MHNMFTTSTVRAVTRK